jgi:PHD/YefM family antitoxin component YafN of YafNO toxin-antitoxin module
MQRLKFDQDIRPLSEFRAGIASFLKQVRNTKRPLLVLLQSESENSYS